MPHPTPSDVPPAISPELLEHLIQAHRREALPGLRRLWRYYRNRTTTSGSGPSRCDQEEGLPQRLSRGTDGQPLREVVIENDIAWRVHAQVDFMFGRPVSIRSLAEDPDQSRRINALLDAVFRASGGVTFLQDLALCGSVYGSADILIRCDPNPNDPAHGFLLELIEAPRAIPLVNPGDYRQLDGYIIHSERLTHRTETKRWRDRWRSSSASRSRVVEEHIECWTPMAIEVMRSSGSGEKSLNALGCVPVVHIQNLPQPFSYAGLSDVEPLIPLQNELNTRLSDRANRVTLASFKMYLAKGLDGFTERPVGPGQMWATDNPDASIESFGGDTDTPSEDSHISEIREAMDKASGVSPIAAGVLRGKVGNLTSENAVRIVLLGLLARTEKKRITYGAGIERCCELILHAADIHGLLPNRPEERRVRIDWPDPFPESRTQQLDQAERKLRLGVPSQQVLMELGYGDIEPAHSQEEPSDTQGKP